MDGYTYEINARTLDKADNYDLSYSTETFTFDVYKPTGTIEQLAGSAIAAYQKVINPISGSGFDGPNMNPSGLALIGNGGSQLRILEKETGDWWDNINGVFNISDGDLAWFKANGGTSQAYTYTHASINGELETGRNYIVQYRGEDKSSPVNTGPSSDGTDSNFTVDKDSVSFIADKVAPVSRITAPADESRVGSLSQISGTAQDALSGISGVGRVEVSIQEVSPGTAYWNGVVGGTFTAVSETFYPLDGATLGGSYDGLNWSFDIPDLRDQYSYRIRVRARDNAEPGGNYETAISSITFIYDNTNPTVSISNPTNNRYYGQNSSEGAYYLDILNGIASDAFDIDKTEVQIYDVLSSSYWHTTGWTVGVSSWQYAGAETWEYAVPGLTDGYKYSLEARTYDMAGNLSAYATSYFYFDSTKPTVKL
ncbi:MAG: hypothetical protein KAJ48_08685, partial [Elusimicrobiales bacterium]|nr:hypothetical protein [Elusimicrobiales bacterium]